jgi:uncharacterized protein (DUF983 family)
MTEQNRFTPSFSARKIWLYLGRSLRLRCPVCGESPLFPAVRSLKSFSAWFETLPGCPRCRYAYDRESGYYMMALWAFDYGPAALFGISLLILLSTVGQLSTGQLLLLVLLPTFIFALLIVRHAKALYLALELLFFHHHDEG